MVIYCLIQLKVQSTFAFVKKVPRLWCSFKVHTNSLSTEALVQSLNLDCERGSCNLEASKERACARKVTDTKKIYNCLHYA